MIFHLGLNQKQTEMLAYNCYVVLSKVSPAWGEINIWWPSQVLAEWRRNA